MKNHAGFYNPPWLAVADWFFNAAWCPFPNFGIEIKNSNTPLFIILILIFLEEGRFPDQPVQKF